MQTNFKKTRWESKKYRDAAKGQNCTMRLPGCSNDTETVVLAHHNGAGVAMKSDDHNAADMCYHCHDIYDRRAGTTTLKATGTGEWLEDRFKRARLETIINRIERGIIK